MSCANGQIVAYTPSAQFLSMSCIASCRKRESHDRKTVAGSRGGRLQALNAQNLGGGQCSSANALHLDKTSGDYNNFAAVAGFSCHLRASLQGLQSDKTCRSHNILISKSTAISRMKQDCSVQSADLVQTVINRQLASSTRASPRRSLVLKPCFQDDYPVAITPEVGCFFADINIIGGT